MRVRILRSTPGVDDASFGKVQAPAMERRYLYWQLKFAASSILPEPL
jgi:hypothetical protein